MPIPAKLPEYQQGGLVSGPGTDYSALWRRQAEANDRKWNAVNQESAPARQPMHQIAPPQMSAHQQAVMADAMNAPSRNWGEALSKIANVLVTGRNNEREAENKRQHLNDQQRRRGVWAQQLHSGASLRDIASVDPGIMGDAEFLSFAKTTTPAVAEEIEMFEDVQNPYGKGGFGQRSSISGQISGYHGAPAQVKPPARATAKDRHGRLRYLDDSSVAFSDDVLGPDPTPPPSQGPSEKDMLAMTRQLSDDWQKTARPMQGLLASSDRMDIGYEMAKAGDMLAGSQAILISFNKLLDPTSVVRESEYARSATGQSALETLKGMAEKLAKGGAGVTLAELDSYRRFGEEVVRNSLESTVGPERKRISRLADRFGVDPELIFSGRFAPQDAAPLDAPEGMPPTAPQAPMVQALESELASSHAMMAPSRQAGPTPRVAPAAAAGQARVGIYNQLDPDALRRQAQTMTASPDTYSDEEKRAMSAAWFKAFGE